MQQILQVFKQFESLLMAILSFTEKNDINMSLYNA